MTVAIPYAESVALGRLRRFEPRVDGPCEDPFRVVITEGDRPPRSSTDGDDSPTTFLGPNPSARLALWTFALVEAGAFALWFDRGRSLWFREDEWEFLANRSVSSPYDLINDHISHWTTLPILTYRVLYQLFGLRTYVPYLLVVLVVHLTCAALLRAVMRRAGVNPWIATAAASLFAFFGAGYEDMIWGVGISFSGALAFGLGYMLLADHDGPVDRRDWLGIAAGLGALDRKSVV